MPESCGPGYEPSRVAVALRPRHSRAAVGLALAAAVWAGAGAFPLRGEAGAVTIGDSACDEVARRSDPGADGPFDPGAHRLINLLEMTLGTWAPTDPASDLYTGGFATNGLFLRLDVVLEGLVNPPGDADPLAFDPFAFGDHPVHGFIEIDMDADENTGGELDAPEYRYLGNIVRFGGIPEEQQFSERIASDGAAFDQDFATKPWVERHGEEFHLALLGGGFGFTDVVEIAGNGDQTFDAGETWDVWASWFHRAHGFEGFSLAGGGSYPGEYAPACDLRFRHDPPSDTTTLSLVYPLTGVAAGAMRGETPEPYNNDPSDQFCVEEAFDDLKDSAIFVDLFGSGVPEEMIILAWKDKNPAEHLDPTGWRVTALLGSSYTAPDPAGEFFVWTDVYPNVIRGNVNGENGSNDDDRNEIQSYIAAKDASDGQVDGKVTLLGFATDFSVFDVNHDGQVDSVDSLLVANEGDNDGDGDADLADFGLFQECYTGSGGGNLPPQCAPADLDGDGDVDFCDVGRFESSMTGPEEAS